MNHKLNTLRKALLKSNLQSESNEIVRLASLGSILLGGTKILGIGFASLKANEYATDYVSKLAGLPEAKEGYNYELYYRVQDPRYKGQIVNYSLYSVVGDIYKFDNPGKPHTKNVVDVFDSESVSLAGRISVTGQPSPYGFVFAPKFGIAKITWSNGAVESVVAEPKETTAPSGTFVMYITSNSIAQTAQKASELGESKRLSPDKEDPQQSSFRSEYAKEISSEEGRKNLVDSGVSFGVDVGTTALLGGSTGAVTWGGTMAAAGTGVAGFASAVVLPAVALGMAGKAGWEIGKAFDQWTGASHYIGPKINSWIESATSKDGLSYELSLEAGRWKPFISKFNLEVVSGSLIDKNKVKIADSVNDAFTANPVSPDQKSTATGKDFGGASFLPTNLTAQITLKSGEVFNVPASTIQLGKPVKLTITEADITTKVSRLISKGKFTETPGMPLSSEDVKAATSVKSKEQAASKQLVSGSPASSAGATPAKSAKPGATTWDEYIAKTGNGQPVKDAWYKWSAALGYSPDDYLSFKSLWKEFARKARNYNIGVSQTATILEALGRARTIDQQNPATNNAFTNQIWDSIAKMDLDNISSYNEYNKKYVA